MSRILGIVILGAALAAVFSAGASATHSDGVGPPVDFARGTGHFNGTLGGGPTVYDIDIDVNATSVPVRADAHGQFSVTTNSFDGITVEEGSGRVTCLDVVGSDAIIGGIVTHGTTGLREGNGVLIQIRDGGESGTDTMDFFQTSGSPDFFCHVTRPAEVPVTEGNFVVHDATP